MRNLLIKVLFWFTRRIIRVQKPFIIGITGSVGKTSTKEAIATVLRQRYRLRASAKSFNNELGLPFTVIGVEEPGRDLGAWWGILTKSLSLLKKQPDYPELLILEMGADRQGNIQQLTGLAPLNVGVLTTIGPSHLEFFKTIDAVVKEKSDIFRNLPADGLAVLNIDDPLIATLTGKVHSKLLTYGFNEQADVRASDDTLSNQNNGWGIAFKINYQGNTVPAFLPLSITKASVSAALAAAAVGLHQGMNLVEVAQALRHFQPPAGRGRLIGGLNGLLLIDDTYNASPQSTKAALTTLQRLAKEMNATTGAVLGEMLELGDYTVSAHQEIGRVAGEINVGFLVAVGEHAEVIRQGAAEAGLPADRIVTVPTSIAALEYLQKKNLAGTLLLVKGSQGTRTERIVRGLMADQSRAEELLVRQSPSWLKR
ncbi:MAG: UDP-N-acetylmuramoyl-tripeptide--D-alanyl-D-alanine ligase [Candidatus Komeilibacteria bacterium]